LPSKWLDRSGSCMWRKGIRYAKIQEKFDTAKKEYSDAKNQHTLMDEALRNAVKNGASSEGITELKQGRVDAQTAMDAALGEVNDIRAKLDATELRAPGKGVVKKVLVSLHAQVEAGETVIAIDPRDHFYLFNKSLAIFSFIAFWVFLGVHILAQ